MKYEECIKELESIVNKIENGELDIDEMSANIKHAQELIKACKDKLTKTEEEINKIQAVDH
ncbi:MAG: exodeoxyribonuclease VII small subunit [Prevotella sp.]|nr:exodeoxyribonuclease VII small subunit [Candidatus Equicola stercoris]MCQ2113902.1 exodeoxyribonuclease VII small subunit [Bacteroidaceae bacterium]